MEEIDKKSAWETVLNVIMTILTLGLNHLAKWLNKKNKK